MNEIGTIWCATVEIQVGRSEWPLSQEFVTLAPTSSVMTPQDCRAENSFNKTRMFGSGRTEREREREREREKEREREREKVKLYVQVLKMKIFKNLSGI